MPTFVKTSRLAFIAIAFAGVLCAFAPLSARAQMASSAQAMGEMSIGKADAPVTLNEYSSLTCPHCARFHTKTLPQIKKDYVDTGKVRIVFNDFPLDGLATGALVIARCSGPERFPDFFDMLYQTQADWSRAEKPLGSLIALARFYGLSGEDVTACLNDQNLVSFVQANRDRASSLYGITSTPSFMLEGEKIEGALSYDEFKDKLDKALAAKGVK